MFARCSLILGRFLLAGLLLLPGYAQAQQGRLKGLDDYITKAMEDWQVPGLAIAVVKDDEVVLAKGYGVRRLGEKAPVDEKTLFAIASCSKPFTVMLLAMLIDAGKLKWDDPVTKHLPNFQMHDPYAAREMTIRDLLCHRSGLARHDLVWFGSSASRDELIHKIRFLEPTWSFRSKYNYQNLMFLTAGEVIPAVTGKSWDESVKEKIFTPLGMTASNTSVKALDLSGNVASPHQKIDDKVQPVPYRDIDNMGPAGSINSNVLEMAQWLRLQLNEGVHDKKKLVSAKMFKEMHQPQVVIQPSPKDPFAKLDAETQFKTYGLGWTISDHRGKKLISHGGSLDGMNSHAALLPDQKLGIIVLTNYRPNGLHLALVRRVADAYLDAPPRDWSKEILEVFEEFEKEKQKDQEKLEKERVPDTKPSLALDKYTGTYKNDAYGEIRVALKNGKLTAHRNASFDGELEYWHFDTFRVTWKDRTLEKSLLTFRLNESGKVIELKITTPRLEDIVAVKAADKDRKKEK